MSGAHGNAKSHRGLQRRRGPSGGGAVTLTLGGSRRQAGGIFGNDSSGLGRALCGGGMV